MTRIDMTTSQWHALITPPLPHASTDKDDPGVCVIRIEAAAHAVYAVATDRHTLGAERHRLSKDNRLWDIPAPIHIRRADADASLKLFKSTAKDDPTLRITIDTVAIPIEAAGVPREVPQLALTLEAPDGTRLTMYDHRDPSQDPLSGWRKTLAKLWRRPLTQAPALSLAGKHLAKWAKAARGGEQLAVYAGQAEGAPVLVLAGSHFAGVWRQVGYLAGPDKMLTDSPWYDELPHVAADDSTDTLFAVADAVADAARQAGMAVTTEGGQTTIHVPETGWPTVLGPWVTAEHESPCAGAGCDYLIQPRDRIRSDGAGGWLCEDCGTEEAGE